MGLQQTQKGDNTMNEEHMVIKICCENMQKEASEEEGIITEEYQGVWHAVVDYEGWYGFRLNFCPFCGKKIELIAQIR